MKTRTDSIFDLKTAKIVAIRCNNCWWHGNEVDLVRGEDEEGFFNGCPNCKTDSYLMDLN